MSWPLFVKAWQSGEMSQNAGGLIRWPVYLLLPLGMALLLLQSASELIKRIAFLRGLIPDPLAHDQEENDSPEETQADNPRRRRAEWNSSPTTSFPCCLPACCCSCSPASRSPSAWRPPA